MGDISKMTISFNGLSIIERMGVIIDEMTALSKDEQIEVINQIKLALHKISPLRNEPVDCVLWVPADHVQANDYNPNVVAPPEMKLLAHSIEADGYTQPIVTYAVNGIREVIDGFHRNLVGKEVKAVRERTLGYLPVTTIRNDREDRNDRISSTIRHNRARGIHQVDNMSEIVVELSRRNWSDEKISRELGMEPDEVLRLKQISGIAELFTDKYFSEAWEIEWN
jgi:ParB-like chromosome segregation protein Spo0J